MTTVSAVDGIKYGIGLIGWVFIIGLVGAGVGGIGFVVTGGGTGMIGRLIGALLFMAGGLIVAAGMLGLLYKAVADANETTNG